MRNYAYTKYTKFHVATAEHRITDTEKVLKYIYLQKLGPGGNWTHTVRAGEGTTTLRVLSPLPSTPTLVTSLPEVAAEWREKSWLDS